MKISVLASGSKGNSTFIETNETHILVDLGTSSLYVEKKLKEIDIDPSTISAIILTHAHVDHISGIKVFMKKYNPKLYLTEKMFHEVSAIFEINNYEIIDGDFNINDIRINVFKTSHDADDSNGYVISNNNRSLVYVTDTGYINQKYNKLLKNRNLYIMESNHDVKMLMEGSYPYHIKQRILGDRGHLSNKDSAYYLSNYVGNETKTIILIHLSHDNNDPSIALNTLEDTLNINNKKVNKILISKQTERTELIEV